MLQAIHAQQRGDDVIILDARGQEQYTGEVSCAAIVVPYRAMFLGGLAEWGFCGSCLGTHTLCTEMEICTT